MPVIINHQAGLHVIFHRRNLVDYKLILKHFHPKYRMTNANNGQISWPNSQKFTPTAHLPLAPRQPRLLPEHFFHHKTSISATDTADTKLCKNQIAFILVT